MSLRGGCDEAISYLLEVVSSSRPRNDINLQVFLLAVFFQMFHNIAYTLRLVRLAHQ